MACCSARGFVITLCVLQLVSTIERQVFDFLGYMWAPILGNFLHIICVIIGVFGSLQYRPRFIAVYAVWNVLWLGWNIFVICLYLEVGVLNRNKDIYILNIVTGNKSWWLENGIGCNVTNTTAVESPPSASRPIPAEGAVQGCLLAYYYVEVIHAAVQIFLSIIGIIISSLVIYFITEEDDSCKYLAHTSTYSPPVEHSVIKYEPVGPAVRTSWALPSYVSYTDSLEWSSTQSSV